MDSAVEKIERNEKILAIIVRANVMEEMESSGNEMHFVSPDSFPFQMGIHNRKKDDLVKPHNHISFVELKDFPVQEFFYVISGKIKVDLYDERENDAKVGEVFINEGDSIILNTGHGFTFLDDAKLIEIKQGPYRGRENEKKLIESDV